MEGFITIAVIVSAVRLLVDVVKSKWSDAPTRAIQWIAVALSLVGAVVLTIVSGNYDIKVFIENSSAIIGAVQVFYIATSKSKTTIAK